MAPISVCCLFQSSIESEALPEHNGWRILRTTDDGEIHICAFQASASRKEDLVTVHVKIVTPEIAKFLFQLLVDGEWVLLPALITAVSSEKGPFHLITSEEELLGVLKGGPYQWWDKNQSTQVSSQS
ncbi:hypothetical protein V8C42DRAFT_338340 [Trichoderma barbatum]